MRNIKLFEEYNKDLKKKSTPKVFLNNEFLDELLFQTPSKEIIKQINSYMNKSQHRYDEDKIRLYHATSSEHDESIEKVGLLPTSMKRKNSLQSSIGYVYMSVFPNMAKTFAEIAFPYNDITIYSVDLYVRDLKLVADKDQLNNKRMYSEMTGLGNTIGDSIIHGHGLRYKGKIPLYNFSIYDKINKKI